MYQQTIRRTETDIPNPHYDRRHRYGFESKQIVPAGTLVVFEDYADNTSYAKLPLFGHWVAKFDPLYLTLWGQSAGPTRLAVREMAAIYPQASADVLDMLLAEGRITREELEEYFKRPYPDEEKN